jgi:protein-disulfide isomerase
VRVELRHFPIRSRHPRAWPAACAVEAAGAQGRLWEMLDALLSDQGRLEDPHLWGHAEALGLDLERFDSDRRSDAVTALIKRDFDGGIRAGVMATPTLLVGDDTYAGQGELDVLLMRFGGRA